MKLFVDYRYKMELWQQVSHRPCYDAIDSRRYQYTFVEGYCEVGYYSLGCWEGFALYCQ